MEQSLTEVFVEVAVAPLAFLLTYRVPPQLLPIQIGDVAWVPLRGRSARGVVVSISDIKPDFVGSEKKAEIKDLQTDPAPLSCLTPDLIKLGKWIASYYGSHLSAVLDTAIPNIAQRPTRLVTLLEVLDEKESCANQLEISPICEVVRQFLVEVGGSANKIDIEARFPGSWKKVSALANKTVYFRLRRERQPIPIETPEVNTPIDIELTQIQVDCTAEIIKAYDARSSQPILVHGITGSGKTEVYIEAIKHVLRRGDQALLLVPEISLTPQLIDRLARRLGEPIAALHSGLSPSMRWHYWSQLRTGSLRIAVGARSAVFAPLPRLGIIFVDEEHDTAYKQFEGVRYNARDVAITRARVVGCPVVLGSATPALETYHAARSGTWRYLSLPSRPGTAKLPSIKVIDLTKIRRKDMASPSLSPTLTNALKETLAAGNQSFLLINRRGFCPYVQCDSCGRLEACPSCSVPLTYHKAVSKLICHHCEYCTVLKHTCGAHLATDDLNPNERCTGQLTLKGAGTERILEEVQSLFPLARIERFDRDTTSTATKLLALLDKLHKREIDIMIGTQMLAKGHDLPNVTLVGVIDTDVGLHIPDFRASERVFQLLTQASGRAGRAELPGQVLLQSRVPDHASIRKTIEGDFLGFCELELKQRQQLRYPPFMRLMRLVSSDSDNLKAQEALIAVRSQLSMLKRERGINLEVLGPVPAPIEKVKNLWRWHLVIKAETAKDLVRTNAFIRAVINVKTTSKIIIDIDPQDML